MYHLFAASHSAVPRATAAELIVTNTLSAGAEDFAAAT
jgi:hypothetical protein